uniref:Uncharacterized protein n=1 Tax=Avena sativa TaxID=4498 RepID=A0ACD5Z3R0_AVESA
MSGRMHEIPEVRHGVRVMELEVEELEKFGGEFGGKESKPTHKVGEEDIMLASDGERDALPLQHQSQLHFKFGGKKFPHRTKNNLLAPVPMDLPKAVGVMSANLSPRYRRIGLQEQYLQDDILHLLSDMQRLRDTLPRMYNLINGAEWRSHEDCVAKVLPKLKDAVDDGDDLLDEFTWHEMKVKLEGNASKSPYIDFFDDVIQGSFNKLNNVQGRLDRISSQMEKMGISEVTKSFDDAVRPQTSSFPNEDEIFGRDNEMKHVMGLLGVPVNSKRKRETSPVKTSTSRSPRNQVSNKPRITNIHVLPIVGIGGVGKTTLVQHICSKNEVKAHFELIIWICVSDDFDVKRLIKEVIHLTPGKKETSDTLDSLQRTLSNKVKNKRFLIVLDDIWDDALKENLQCWKKFCAPLKSAHEGRTDNVRAFSKLISLYIFYCDKLYDGLLTPEYLPAIERIHVSRCPELLSLSGERLGVLSSLKHLHVHHCKSLSWQSGLVLPSSLQTLELDECEDFSACIPGCLENLTSLVSLKIVGCQGLTSIPGYIWRSKLPLLEELVIDYCHNLDSIGGAKAVAKIKKVEITQCPKLKEARQIRRRRSANGTQIRS